MPRQKRRKAREAKLAADAVKRLEAPHEYERAVMEFRDSSGNVIRLPGTWIQTTVTAEDFNTLLEEHPLPIK